MRTILLLLLLSVGHAQDLFLEARVASQPSQDVDVIIVGAGWAGMAAADSLARANVSFVVLEADNHTGGRSHAIKFGHPSVGKFVFEKGSNWVSGTGGGAAFNTKHGPRAHNPVQQLAIKEKLKTLLIPGAADGNMSNIAAVFDPNGKDADPTGALRKRANAALDCLNRTVHGDHNKTDSARDRLEKCGWKPKSDAEWAMDWMMTEDDPGEPGRLVHRLFPDETYMWWGPNDWFVVDQHPRGFARLIDGMVRDSVPEGDTRVVFNAHVAKIEWGCDSVIASTKDGRTFKGKHAITTVSLGVLQMHHEELFSPPLPKKHAEALSQGDVMGNLTHVLVQFPKVWWNNSLPRWISANHGGQAMAGEFTEWQNMNHETIVPGSQTLLSFLGDPQAQKYQRMNDADLKTAVVQRLRIQNPDVDIPDAVAVFISRWGTDPKFYGSYSSREPGFREKFFSAFKRPLKACKKAIVRFSGEAMCDDLNGFTHGAYQAGKESAARYLYDVGKGPNPDDDDALSLCDW